MRLTVDLRMYRHSGIGRYLRNIFPLLLPQLIADEIRVLGSKELFGEEAWLKDPRIELFETHAPIYSVQEQLLGRRGAYLNTDLLWVPHYNGPLLYKGKMLATIHDIAPIAVPHILDSILKRAYASLLIRRTIAQSAALLCVSEFTRTEIALHIKTAPKDQVVTHVGVDMDWPQSAEVHKEQDGVSYLLFVGNIKPNKNLRLLLKAFDLIKDRVPHRLVLAGRMHGFTTNDENVLRQAKQLGNRVRFTGEISDEALQQLYAGSVALIVPSIYEGFGSILLEAMQIGCPVLSSTAGSLQEVGGHAPMYFDPQDHVALSECLLKLENADVRQQLVARGHERINRFSYFRCAEKTSALINSILQSVTCAHD